MIVSVKRVAVYIRVSTGEQNIDSQRDTIRRWLDNHGITDVEWYVDTSTRDNFDRPQWQRMQSDVFHGRIGTVVCYKLDRLSGDMVGGLSVLQDWLDRGIRLVSVTQEFDFSGTIGKMVASLLLGISEMEQSTRRERQRAGIEAAKRRGVYKGGCEGYRKIRSGPRKAAALRQRGFSRSEIAKQLGVSITTVKQYLREAGALMPPARLGEPHPSPRYRRQQPPCSGA